MKAQNETNDSLITAAQNGNMPALAAATTNFVQRLLRRRVPAQDLDDVVQDVLHLVISKLDQLSDPASIKPWVSRLAHNVMSDYWRKRYRENTESLPNFTEDISNCRDSDLPESTLIEDEDKMRLLEAIKMLPDNEQEALRQYYVEQRTTEEIATAMNKPRGTIRRWMYNGRESLREQLESI